MESIAKSVHGENSRQLLRTHRAQKIVPSAHGRTGKDYDLWQGASFVRWESMAIGRAKRALSEKPVQPVPSSIRDRHGRNKKPKSEDEESYLYSHEFPENVSGQKYLEDPLDLYLPKSAGAEGAIAERLLRWKGIRTEISRKKDP